MNYLHLEVLSPMPIRGASFLLNALTAWQGFVTVTGMADLSHIKTVAEARDGN